MYKQKYSQLTASDLDSEVDAVPELKKRRVDEVGDRTYEELKEKNTQSSSAAQENPQCYRTAFQKESAEQNFSQNKNQQTLWCTAAQSSSGDLATESFWDISASKSFDHAVDDPMFWGPYLSERQWGTVREDFSENDNCWEHVSHEDAVHHAYVSGEDGLLGVSDKCQLLCAATALWNGKDSVLKERLFGLTGIEGNHGEDVKELYYYLDSLPDHSYMRALYKYPQAAFPYQWLREENRNRTFHDPEFELLDTGVFEESGHWDVTVEYAKTDHLGLACHIEVTNNGRQKENISVIPQFWFRHVQKQEPIPQMSSLKPLMKASSDGTVKLKYCFGNWRLIFIQESRQGEPTLLFTDNVSSPPADKAGPQLPLYTRNAFHKYIVEGKYDAVCPMYQGTKCGALYNLSVAAGAKVSVYWRIESYHYPLQLGISELKNHFVKKRKEAQAYYDSLMPKWNEEERSVAVQAMAGLHWSKQYYCFDVKAWLQDYRRCRENRGDKGRNCKWSHLSNNHILLMPDKWEFPWYAGWDLCISADLYSRFSPAFAKQQMLTFLSDAYMHPQGQLPGCEFELGDPNPPLQAWAVLRVFRKDGGNDFAFLRKCFHRLLFNYNWWCGKEHESTNLYGRGFLGMDNISVVDRSGPLLPGWSLVQADCTGWMACFCLWMMQIAVELGQNDLVYCDLIPKFLNHFLNIAVAINKSVYQQGLWHDEDRFFYDAFYTPEGKLPIRLRSMSGLIPLLACTKVRLRKFSTAAISFDSRLTEFPQHVRRLNDNEVMLSVLCLPRVQSVLERVFSEDEFWSPFGIRSLSKVYEAEPFSMTVGDQHLTVKYTPGESDSGAFGGNSNWRGPVWVFMNYLLLESLDKYCSGSPSSMNLRRSSQDAPTPVRSLITRLERNLLSIFLPDRSGRRPVHGAATRYTEDPKWRPLVLFYEYIHAETGRGCGASHQTGWTAAIIEILYRLHGHIS